MGGELAGTCRQDMIVTSWEGVRDGDTGYYKHRHAALFCFLFQSQGGFVSKIFDRQQQKHRTMIVWLSFTSSFYYHRSPASNESRSMSRADMVLPGGSKLVGPSAPGTSCSYVSSDVHLESKRALTAGFFLKQVHLNLGLLDQSSGFCYLHCFIFIFLKSFLASTTWK